VSPCPSSNRDVSVIAAMMNRASGLRVFSAKNGGMLKTHRKGRKGTTPGFHSLQDLVHFCYDDCVQMGSPPSSWRHHFSDLLSYRGLKK
jgi:hypothetical protein